MVATEILTSQNAICTVLLKKLQVSTGKISPGFFFVPKGFIVFIVHALLLMEYVAE